MPKTFFKKSSIKFINKNNISFWYRNSIYIILWSIYRKFEKNMFKILEIFNPLAEEGLEHFKQGS